MKINKTAEVKRLSQAAYPDYTGRKFALRPFDPSMELRSFWDEGSKTDYRFVNVDTLQVHEVHSNHPFFEANQPRQCKELPVGVVLVAHDIFMGKDIGITFFVRPDEMPRWLPSPIKVA